MFIAAFLFFKHSVATPLPMWSIDGHYLERKMMSFSSSLLVFSLRGAHVFRQNITFGGSKRLFNYQPLLKCTQNCQISAQTTSHHTFCSRQNTSTAPSLFLWGHSNILRQQTSNSHMQVRTVTKYSKLGKRKTVKSVAKRFIRTGSGKLKYWPAGKVHNMLAKSRKRRLQLRKARYANKTQLKTLNKMISGW